LLDFFEKFWVKKLPELQQKPCQKGEKRKGMVNPTKRKRELERWRVRY